MLTLKQTAQLHPAGVVGCQRKSGNEGLAGMGSHVTNRLDPGQLLNQIAGKRTFGFVQQLGQSAHRAVPRRKQRQVSRRGFGDQHFDQGPPDSPAWDHQHDVVQVPLGAARVSVSQILDDTRQRRATPIQKCTCDRHDLRFLEVTLGVCSFVQSPTRLPSRRIGHPQRT